MKNVWHGDHELLYAEHLDAVCDTVANGMRTMYDELGCEDFMRTMQTIIKEVTHMAAKDPVINLIDFRHLASTPGGHPRFGVNDHFRVDTMKNTTQYRAGSFLTEIIVNDLINLGWTVNIRQPAERDFS